MTKSLTTEEVTNFFSTNNLSDYYVREDEDKIIIKEKSSFFKNWLGRLIRRIFGIYRDFNHKQFLGVTKKILDYLESKKDSNSHPILDQYKPEHLNILKKRVIIKQEIDEQINRIRIAKIRMNENGIANEKDQKKQGVQEIADTKNKKKQEIAAEKRSKTPIITKPKHNPTIITTSAITDHSATSPLDFTELPASDSPSDNSSTTPNNRSLRVTRSFRTLRASTLSQPTLKSQTPTIKRRDATTSKPITTPTLTPFPAITPSTTLTPLPVITPSHTLTPFPAITPSHTMTPLPTTAPSLAHTAPIPRRSTSFRSTDVLGSYKKNPEECSDAQKMSLFWQKDLTALQDLLKKFTNDRIIDLRDHLTITAIGDYLIINGRDNFTLIVDWILSSKQISPPLLRKFLEVFIKKTEINQPISEFDLNRLLTCYSQQYWRSQVALSDPIFTKVIPTLLEQFPNQDNTINFVTWMVDQPDFSFPLLRACANTFLKKMETHCKNIEYPAMTIFYHTINIKQWNSQVSSVDNPRLRQLLNNEPLSFISVSATPQTTRKRTSNPDLTYPGTPQTPRHQQISPRPRLNTLGSTKALESFKKHPRSCSTQENMTLFQDIRDMDHWKEITTSVTENEIFNLEDPKTGKVITGTLTYSTLGFSETLVEFLLSQRNLKFEILKLCLEAIKERYDKNGTVSSGALYSLLKHQKRYFSAVTDEIIDSSLALLKRKDSIMATSLINMVVPGLAVSYTE